MLEHNYFILTDWEPGVRSVDNEVSRHDTNKSRQAQATTLSLEKTVINLHCGESIKKGSQAGWLYREERDIFISIIKLGL